MSILFNPETEEQYNYAFEVLPPALYGGKGFLLGEPMTHRRCRISGLMAPVYDAHLLVLGRYLVSDEPMTVAEFKVLKLDDVRVE